MEEGLQDRQEWLKMKGWTAEADVVEGVLDTYVLTTSIYNTSTDKGWILDSDSVVHVCSQKEMFNSLIAKEEGTVKMVDGSACKVIGTETVNVTGRYLKGHALEMVWYVLVQFTIHRSGRLRGMSDPSVSRSHHG